MKFLIVLFGLCVMQSSAFAHEQSNIEQVSVVGAGEVKAEPDQVILLVSVYAIEKDLKSAKRVADERYQTVLDELKTQGISDKDIKVARLDMRPEYEWTSQKRVHKGERVNRSLTIVLKDLAKVTPVLQGLVEQGVSTVDNMSAGFQDEAELKRQALANAVQDAKGKAQFLAEQLDRGLGAAFNIVEQNGAAPMFQDFGMARGSTMKSEAFSPPPEMFGTQTITANITVAFKLGDLD